MLGQPLRYYDSVASTNEVALAWAREGAPHGAVVTAKAQTSGRGRRGRSWTSPAGKGLYLSLVLRPSIEPSQVPQLTMLAALASALAVEKLTGLTASTKWPNDILLHGRKTGGILSEAEFKNGRLDFAIVGIGLNVNFQIDDLPPRPIFPATSLLIETGRAWPVDELRQELLQECDRLYAIYTAGGWETLRADFAGRCAGLGQPVRVVEEAETYSGVASMIDADGILVVQTATGPRRVVAGDVVYS